MPELDAFAALGIWYYIPPVSIFEMISPPFVMPLWIPTSAHGLPLFLHPISWNPLALVSSMLSTPLPHSPFIIYITLLQTLSTIWMYRLVRSSDLSNLFQVAAILLYAFTSVTLLNLSNVEVYSSWILLPIWIDALHRSLSRSSMQQLWILASITFIASLSLILFPWILLIQLFICVYKIYTNHRALAPQRSLWVLLISSTFYGWLQYESLIYYHNISPELSWINIAMTHYLTHPLNATTVSLILTFHFFVTTFFFKKNKISFDNTTYLRQYIVIAVGIILVVGITTITKSYSSFLDKMNTDAIKQNHNIIYHRDSASTADHLLFLSQPLLEKSEKLFISKSIPLSSYHFPMVYYSADSTTSLPKAHFGEDRFNLISYDYYHRLTFDTKSHKTQNIIFNQPYSPHWQVKIDEQRSQIQTTANQQMQITIKPGAHRIEFDFWPGGLINLYLTSIALLLIIITYLCLRSIKKNGIVLLPMILLFSLVFWTKKNALPRAIVFADAPTDTLTWHMDYEYNQPEWNLNTRHIDIEKSNRGFRSERLNDQQIYSATLAIPFKRSYTGKKLKFQFNVLTATDVKFAVVLVVKKDSLDQHQIHYLEALGNEDWSTISNQFELPSDHSTVDSLAFYLWNYEKNDFRVDDIKTEIKE